MSYPFDEDIEISDDEILDQEQAAQEEITQCEIDKMFNWWEDGR